MKRDEVDALPCGAQNLDELATRLRLWLFNVKSGPKAKIFGAVQVAEHIQHVLTATPEEWDESRDRSKRAFVGKFARGKDTSLNKTLGKGPEVLYGSDAL